MYENEIEHFFKLANSNKSEAAEYILDQRQNNAFPISVLVAPIMKLYKHEDMKLGFSYLMALSPAISGPRYMTLRQDFSQNMGSNVEGLIYESKYDESQTVIDRILTFDSNSPVAHRLQGLLLLEKGQTELAINSFEKSLTVDPTYAYAYLQLAMVYAKDKNIEMTMKNLIECRKNGIKHYAMTYETEMQNYPVFDFVKDVKEFKDLFDIFPKDKILRDIYQDFVDDRLNLVLSKGKEILTTHEDPMAIAQIMYLTINSIIGDLREHGDENLDLYELDSSKAYKMLKREIRDKIEDLEDEDYSNEVFQNFKSSLND